MTFFSGSSIHHTPPLMRANIPCVAGLGVGPLSSRKGQGFKIPGDTTPPSSLSWAQGGGRFEIFAVPTGRCLLRFSESHIIGACGIREVGEVLALPEVMKSA